MKKKWEIKVSQNYWEYAVWVVVTAENVVKIGDTVVIADGVEIDFDEEVGEIRQCSPGNN